MTGPDPASIRISVEDGALSCLVAGGVSSTTVNIAPYAGLSDAPVQVSLPPSSFWRAKNLDLWDAEVGKRLAKIAEGQRLASELELFVTGAAPGALTTISGMRAADIIPWEALGNYFRHATNEERYRPVRLVAPERPWNLRTFDERMRLLLVVGHEGRTVAFNAEEQKQRIMSALSGLRKDTETIFAPATDIPTLSLATEPRANWPDAFKRAEPHVVMYFGHGVGGKAPALRFGPGNNDWVPLLDLAAEIAKLAPFPPFWIFLSCSLGESEPGADVVAGPEAFRVLSEQGALTMLAMRARIRVDLAEIVAKSVIQGLLDGQSIESAAAEARHAARNSRRNTGNGLLDWAAPAVWSIGSPPQTLSWGSTAGPSAASVCVRLLRQAASDPPLGLDAVPDWAAEYAGRWKQARRVRVPYKWSDNDREFVARIAAVLSAAASQLAAKVLLVVPPPGRSFVARLNLWAKQVRARLSPALHAGEIAGVLKEMESGDSEGLSQLLHLEGMFVVFVEPPGLSSDDRVVWEQFATAQGATIVVCHDPAVEIDHMKNWSADQLTSGQPMKLDASFSRQRQSLGLLAVLDRPVSLAALAAVTGEDTQELAGADFLIDSPASGVVLSAGARERLVAGLGKEGVKQAHMAYLAARQHATARISALDDMEDLRHLIGAELWPQTAAAVNHLVQVRHDEWTAADWLQLGRLLEHAGPAYGGIRCNILLEIASQLVERQDLQIAGVWLERIECRTTLDAARRASLRSEVYKAEAEPEARDKMWEEAQRAVDLCSSVAADDPDHERARSDLRHYKQSLARLKLYFGHDAPAARLEFERLMTELEPEADSNSYAARAYIAAARNLSECLFEFEPYRRDLSLRLLAHQTLDAALKVALKHRLSGLAAEVAYSQAKLAEAQPSIANAVARLQKCIEYAREAAHAVCYRIADMRLYWVDVRAGGRAFDYSEFRMRQSSLDFLTWHAWAARYAGQSRLWAAYRLNQQGNKPAAKALLLQNLEAFEDRPGLEASSDRRFVALSRAGLAVIGEGDEGRRAWSSFLELGWSGKWLEPLPSREPAAIWAGCA